MESREMKARARVRSEQYIESLHWVVNHEIASLLEAP